MLFPSFFFACILKILPIVISKAAIKRREERKDATYNQKETGDLFKDCKALNVYQVNIWKNLVFMHQINSNTVPTIFLNKFKKPTHNYPKSFARNNYSIV